MKHTGIVLLFAALSVSCLGRTTMLKRISKEIKNIQNEPTSLVSITMFGEERQASSISIVQEEENNLFKWKVAMKGPEGTLFEGGIFVLDVTLPEDYPFYPPRIKFLSTIIHPNIYEDGGICLDILREKWSPAQTMFSALVSIQALLSDPYTSSAANGEIGKLFYTNKAEYEEKVREATKKTNPGLAANNEPSASPEMAIRVKETSSGASHEDQTEEVLD
ncbi:MAG: ubiquitin-conjugating enzyme E2 [Amphiamblys sp. WSBS2006]|nr:MAG: ubiquitin-conjugating enzyme E2 [Amphiamblys sp. WSBS2006]